MKRLKMFILLFTLSLIFSGRIFSEEIDPILKRYNLSPDQVEKIHIKIGTLAPVGTPWIDFVYDTLIPRLTKESRGVLKIQLYAGGVMGEDTDILRKMKLGQLQGCGCTALGIFAAAPKTSVLTLPLLFNNYEEVDFILDKFRSEIDRMFEERGFYLMGLIDTGFFYLYMKNMAGSLEEIKKQKMLTWFGDIETTTLNELGINPIKVSVPEIVTSLQTGLINANIGPPTWQMGTQAYIYTKYYISKPLFYSIAAIILDKEQLDKIIKKYPPGLGEEVVNLTRRLIKGLENEWRAKIRDYETRSLRAFENAGMKRLDLSEDDLQKLEKASESVWYKLANKLYPEELMLNIIKELRAFRSARVKK